MKIAHWTLIAGLSLAGLGYLYFAGDDVSSAFDSSVPTSITAAGKPLAGPELVSVAQASSSQVTSPDSETSALDSEMLTGVIERLSSPDSSGSGKGERPSSERVYLSANEKVRIPLNRSALRSDRPVVLRADHGGVIDGRALSPQVELSADASGFTFHVGAHRGLYTVTVSQDARTEILEFWVGEPSPVGRAGPPRDITPPAAVSAES